MIDTADHKPALPADERTIQLGLLMEAAVAQQQAAEKALDTLQEHIQGIDAAVRDEIRRTFVDELVDLHAECQRATHALATIKSAAQTRVWFSSLGVTAVCLGLSAIVLHSILPSRGEIETLRAERERYTAAVEQLARRGGRSDLRRCGSDSRLCVRIDPNAPVFGEHRDYRVIQGY